MIRLWPPCGARCPQAHDIPNDVTVQAFLKPEGQRLRLLVRVPLKAMRDVEFPRRGQAIWIWRAPDRFWQTPRLCGSPISSTIYEDDVQAAEAAVLATSVSLESDRSFASYEEALAHVTGAGLPLNTNVVWNQTMLDVLFEYPIQSDRSDFSIHPGLDRLGVRVVTVLRFLFPGGGSSCARSSSTAIPASSSSIRAGIRRRCAS